MHLENTPVKPGKSGKYVKRVFYFNKYLFCQNGIQRKRRGGVSQGEASLCKTLYSTPS